MHQEDPRKSIYVPEVSNLAFFRYSSFNVVESIGVRAANWDYRARVAGFDLIYCFFIHTYMQHSGNVRWVRKKSCTSAA